MRALSKDTKNKDSGAPCYFVVDEYHAHPNSEIYEIGTNSFGKRTQSLLDVITTAGDNAGSKPATRRRSTPSGCWRTPRSPTRAISS